MGRRLLGAFFVFTLVLAANSAQADFSSPNWNLKSSSHTVSTPSKNNQISFSWSSMATQVTGGASFSGYSYLLDTTSGTIPDSELEVSGSAAGTFANVVMTASQDGTSYYFHIKAVDGSGNTNTSHLGPYIIDTGGPSSVAV